MKCEKCGKETETPVLVKLGAGTMFVGPDCAKRGIRSGEFRKYTQDDRVRDALKTDKSQIGARVSLNSLVQTADGTVVERVDATSVRVKWDGSLRPVRVLLSNIRLSS